MNHDRAERPDPSQGSDPSPDRPRPMGGSLPDIRAQQGGGTYFLGRYRIVDEIGIGGMASVHLARMDGPGGFQKWVAIKKIHPHLVEDESFVQMFLDEARVAARISHPNVATVFDLGKHDDTYWIAMEYLHGEPLREVMRRTEELGTAMPPEIACRVIADAAEGLHAAHELLGKAGEKLGLVHRDVTPHNLFVTYDGVTKVVDFGIAKFSSRMSHTRAGTLKGKLAYMSPEQVHGEGIDRRTDIFALGVVLWELTTGQRLFRMESDLDTLAKVQECNVPRPSTLIRGYPVDLEKIVMKALAKNRGERFRTAREFSRALQSLLMRRGLFIASDEVAAYTQSIFNDRIQKREAHLRWASEVTSTINIDQLLTKPKLGPEFTNSELQSQKGGPGPVRPAAGMPVADAAEPPTQPPPAYANQQQPNQARAHALQQTGPSVATNVVAPQPSRVPPAAPRPAAGIPAATMQSAERGFPLPPPPDPELEDEHPADGDGPTIQALPPMVEEYMGPSLGPSLPPHGRSEPPTISESGAGAPRKLVGNHDSMTTGSNDVPTVMSSPQTRSKMVGRGSDPSLDDTIDPDDLEDDQDQTVVANTRAEQASPLQAPPTFPQSTSPITSRPNGPSPLSPMPLGAPPQIARASPFAQTAQLGQQAPHYPPQQQHSGFPAPPLGGHSHSGEISFAETLGMAQPMNSLSPLDPNVHAQGGQMSNPGFDFGIPRSGQYPTGPNDFNPRPSQRVVPTMGRMGAPAGTYDNRTMTAQRFKRRPPMWVVAALSCSIALLIAGVVIAIVSSTGTSTPKQGSVTVATGTAAAAGASGGPFTTARAAFNGVVNQPGSSITPASTPVVPASAAPGSAPAPAMTAAADTASAPPSSAPNAASAVVNPATATIASKPAAPAPQTTASPVVATAKPAVAAPAQPQKPAALGAITVVCMPKCDQIIDNGASLGPGHIFNRPVASGRHVLQLSAPNGQRKTLMVDVAPEQTKEVRMSMDR